jgi:predicted PolB exonuclease-like 3'-5' exonuclease
MLNEVKKENILFIDVETVPQYKDYEAVPENKKKFWEHKASFLAKGEEQTPENLYERAGIYSEFGKIICISSGFIKTNEGNTELHVKSFYGHDERTILTQFLEVVNKLGQSPQKWYLCAHNGKEFDFPYICRRLLVNGLGVPNILDVRGKYQKEVQLLDTMEMWKFGDYKSFVSLDLLADIFNIPSPKDDMDGSMVRAVYYEEDNLEKIVEYCGKDVITLTQVLMRYKGEPFIPAQNIKMVP